MINEELQRTFDEQVKELALLETQRQALAQERRELVEQNVFRLLNHIKEYIGLEQLLRKIVQIHKANNTEIIIKYPQLLYINNENNYRESIYIAFDCDLFMLKSYTRAYGINNPSQTLQDLVHVILRWIPIEQFTTNAVDEMIQRFDINVEEMLEEVMSKAIPQTKEMLIKTIEALHKSIAECKPQTCTVKCAEDESILITINDKTYKATEIKEVC